MRTARPYRTDLWPRWSRRGAALSSMIARQWFARAPAGALPLDERLASVLGEASFELRFLSVQTRESLAKTYAERPSIFALFATDAGPCAVAIDATIARWMAAKCSGLEGAQALRWLAPMPWTAQMEGAFALACILAAKALCEPGPPPVFRAATDRWEDVDHALAQGECAVWPAIARVGECAGGAALIVPASAVRATRTPALALDERLASLTVEARLLCARALLARDELAAITPGAVLALGAPLFKIDSRAIGGPMTLSLGPVECAAQVDATTVRCDGPLLSKRTPTMNDGSKSAVDSAPQDSSVTTDAGRTALLSSVPVEVEVVIARGSFAVGEVAAWRPGEVVALPTRVGEPVELRAGGRVIARGELCDVEGEIGVRILTLL